MNGWISGVGARTAFIEPGSPWENGYVESFNGKLRDELLAAGVFNTLLEARVLIEQHGCITTGYAHTHHWATGHPHRRLAVSTRLYV